MTDNLTPGTRVHHRRYPWMQGIVKDEPGDTYVTVRWFEAPYGSERFEYIKDLRATPVQPSKPA